MTEPAPVWDGRGDDPWLPERVNALLDAADAERSIYEVVWEALSEWMVVTSRRVLAGHVPQPEEIFAQVPAWQEATNDIITDGILPVMAWAYQGLFGSAFGWEDRPNVLAYLAGVANRLSGVPEEVFDLVSGQLAAGVTLGEGIPALTERVDNLLSLTNTPRWKNRSVTIARTESMGALNSSRADAFQAYAEEDHDEELERIWLSTSDLRTRPSHAVADGQRAALNDPFMVGGFPLAFPGDPAGPPGEVINCLPSWQRVSVQATALVERSFDGVLVQISTAAGHELAATSNHPVLTRRGWRFVGGIQPGDYVLCRTEPRPTAGSVDPYVAHSDPTCEEVARAIQLTVGGSERVSAVLVDLDGDIVDRKVQVVRTDLPLSFGFQPEEMEQLAHLSVHGSASQVGGSDDGSPGGVFRHADVHGLGLSARGQREFFEYLVDGVPLDTQPLGDGLDGHVGVVEGGNGGVVEGAPLSGASGGAPVILERLGDYPFGDAELSGDARDGDELALVHLDNGGGQLDSGIGLGATVPGFSWHQVTSRIERPYVGSVYDFEAVTGLIAAGGIITANCRCTTLLLEKGESVNLSNRQFKRRR